jgi:hypothetical protein
MEKLVFENIPELAKFIMQTIISASPDKYINLKDEIDEMDEVIKGKKHIYLALKKNNLEIVIDNGVKDSFIIRTKYFGESILFICIDKDKYPLHYLMLEKYFESGTYISEDGILKEILNLRF